MTEQTVGQVLEQDHHVIDEYFAVFARSLEAAANETGALDVLALETGVRALIAKQQEIHGARAAASYEAGAQHV